jgi:hypothetical protein
MKAIDVDAFVFYILKLFLHEKRRMRKAIDVDAFSDADADEDFSPLLFFSPCFSASLFHPCSFSHAASCVLFSDSFWRYLTF